MLYFFAAVGNKFMKFSIIGFYTNNPFRKLSQFVLLVS